jgi:Domain of unknown function (DUF4276)
VKVKIFVEGGGDHNKTLATHCRKGFSKFFEKAGLENRMPRVVACGGRSRAYDSFRTSHENAGPDDFPILLVDSEAPVAEADPWEHVRLRAGDGWERPDGASQDQIHLMVQAMEAWFHADKEKVQEYFGQGFRLASLRQRPDIDNISKADLFTGMQMATRDCPKKGEYSKGQHSFEILALIDPAKVRASSPVHAGRLLNVLDRICVP